MNNVVSILMKRDGITELQAVSLIEETKEALLAADPYDAEDIIADYLGLEMDYIFDILDI